MRFPLSFVFSACTVLTIALAVITGLTRGILAAGAGEIAFETNRDGNWEIYLLDVQTGTRYNFTRSSADDFSPAWSPDGSQLAFISDRDSDNHSEVYIVNADGSGLRRLGAGSSIYLDPDWTSDGNSLVLTRGWQQIFRVDAGSSSEQWLGIGFSPHLSPDRTQLLYYADGSGAINSHIYVLNLNNRHITDLTSGATHNWDGAWSPNGREIVFVSSRSGKTLIYVMNADGSNMRAVAPGDNALSPSWTPDGARIVYAAGAMGAMQLYVINADGSGRQMLTSGSGDSHAPVWRPQSR